MTRRGLTMMLMSLALGSLATTIRGNDWPQWMGPQRDNIYRENGVLERIPEGGLKVLWRVPVAGGYAGPAVAGGMVFCSEYQSTKDLGEGNFARNEADGTETLFALDQATGKRLWEHRYPVRYTISYPAGPRCTPIVDGDLVYFLGAEGNLIACQAKTGAIVWQRDLKKDYQTKSALWGYAGHPLIDGDQLITLAGGEGSHVVALNKKTGAEIWKSQSSEEQGYCPPVILEAGGVRQLILCGPRAIKGLNPQTGERYWSTPYNADNGSIIMTPVRIGDYLFIGGYSNKNLLLKLDRTRPEVTVVAKDQPKKFISPVNVQPLVIDQTLYGFDQDGQLYAVEIPSGKRLWSTPEAITDKPLQTGTAFLIRVGEKIWLFNELGELVIATMSPQGFSIEGRTKIVEPTGRAFGRKVVWCMPALANKTLFVRNDKELVAVSVSKTD